MKIAGFVCPFYMLDETKLNQGFGVAVSGIGTGQLEKFPRYQNKFDKLLKIAVLLNNLFGTRIHLELEILMGDTGVINANKFIDKDSDKYIERNIDSYKKYMSNNYSKLSAIKINFSRISDKTGSFYGLSRPFSDLVEDGKKIKEGTVSFYTNGDVMKKVENDQMAVIGKGGSVYESLGFMLNYGIAGMILRNNGTDILIGTDSAGSYMNYLYHSFIKYQELFVVVPK